MFTPLAKLAIGLSATMATAFYYLAAAPPASAQLVCGSGNFSPACTSIPQSPTTQPPRVIRSPAPVVASPSPVIASPVPVDPVVASPSPVIASPVPVDPVVASPSPVIVDTVPVDPVVASPSPVIVDTVPVDPVVASPSPVIADPVPQPTTELPTGSVGGFQNIYTTYPSVKPPTAIPEPGTVLALLGTGAGIICSGRKRNKQVRQQR
jgi:hypothetical protein